LQRCCSGVAAVLQRCCSGVAAVLQRCPPGRAGRHLALGVDGGDGVAGGDEEVPAMAGRSGYAGAGSPLWRQGNAWRVAGSAGQRGRGEQRRENEFAGAEEGRDDE
jgi:hypothetical protein